MVLLRLGVGRGSKRDKEGRDQKSYDEHYAAGDLSGSIALFDAAMVREV
jgi:hypothetical protein